MTAATLARPPEEAVAPADVRRETLLGDLAGTVLELGPGTGANFDCLPRGIRWIGLEPDRSVHGRLRQAAAEHGHDGPVVAGVAEEIPESDGSIDAVVATFVLCSVSDQERALAEIARVLRPGGRFVFVEHVSPAPRTWSRRALALWAPFSRVWDGCDPTRDTQAAIEGGPFHRVDLRGYAVPGPFRIEIPHVAGCAIT